MSIFANYKYKNMKLSHKALRGAAVIAVILTTVLLPSSCDDNVWRAANWFSGSWYTTSDDGYYMTRLDLYDDFTGTITQYDGNTITDYARFQWEATRHTIVFYYTDREPEQWDIDFDGRNAFRLYLGDGDYALFVRDY